MSAEMQKLFEDVNGKRVTLPKTTMVNLCMDDNEQNMKDVFHDVAGILKGYGYNIMIVTDMDRHETNLFGYRRDDD